MQCWTHLLHHYLSILLPRHGAAGGLQLTDAPQGEHIIGAYVAPHLARHSSHVVPAGEQPDSISCLIVQYLGHSDLEASRSSTAMHELLI